MKSMVCVYKYIIQENNRLFRKPPLLGPPLSLPECDLRQPHITDLYLNVEIKDLQHIAT